MKKKSKTRRRSETQQISSNINERIPEKIVQARGLGVHGYFETLTSLSHITSADIFQRKHEKTPAFVRFSTATDNKASFDLARNVCSFTVKLYTKQGGWDIVSNNIPVFLPQAETAHENFWDFISLMPENMHMIMWMMSDRALPRSFRFMEGFGVHTFHMMNAKGKSSFVKFLWKPKQGLQSVVWNEAVKINGADPDFHRRDLWDAIKNGDFPEWELGLQVFDEKFADGFAFDVFDTTNIIPEEQVPMQIVGRLVLNRCVENYFAETEQDALCPPTIVSGIDICNPNITSLAFADHYSQAKQFYQSQTPAEQHHLANALIFELSKVNNVGIRTRMVSLLLNIEKKLGIKVGDELGITTPKAAPMVKPISKAIIKADSLSIILNGPGNFSGRKMGILLTDNADNKLYHVIINKLKMQNIAYDVIAPKISGVRLKNGEKVIAQQSIQSGPSVLYDAVILLVSDPEATKLAHEQVVRDFISDAYHHFKFMAYVKEANPLIQAAGIQTFLDEGCIIMSDVSDFKMFLIKCNELRFWKREEIAIMKKKHGLMYQS